MRVEDVTRSQIDRFHKPLRNTPYQANRILAQLSRLFNLAETWGWRSSGSNPCRRVERFREEPRTRFLRFEEIDRLGAALFELEAKEAILPQSAAAIRLLLLTGARLNEILRAERGWIDLEHRLIHLPNSKTGPRTLFLSEPAAAVVTQLLASNVASRYLLPGRRRHSEVAGGQGDKPINNLSKTWRLVQQHATLHGVRIHDLRHTAASVAVGRGASLSLIGRLLGHSQPQTTQRYAHVDIDPALAVANSIGAAIGPSLGLRQDGDVPNRGMVLNEAAEPGQAST
jgi:integrase